MRNFLALRLVLVPIQSPRQLRILSTFVSDKRDDHAVEVEEEHEQMEAELDERLFLVDVEFSEDFGRVEEVLIFEDPTH